MLVKNVCTYFKMSLLDKIIPVWESISPKHEWSKRILVECYTLIAGTKWEKENEGEQLRKNVLIHSEGMSETCAQNIYSKEAKINYKKSYQKITIRKFSEIR